MNTLVLHFTKCVLFAGLIFGASILAAERDDEERATALADIRAAAAGRDLIAVREKLAAAGKLKGKAEYDVELLRLEELCDYLEKFWQAVERGAKTLDGTQELLIGEERVAFVEFENGTLVLRVKGQNRSYTSKTLPAKIALTLSQQVMKPEAAANKVFFGAFLVLDARGDVDLARKMFSEASAGGVEVKRLLPELDAERPLPPIEIPPLTPALKNQLAEKNWSLRVKGIKGWTRQALDKRAMQNSEGRLAVQVPTEESDTLQLIAKKPIAGDFVARLILTDVKKGQTLGLFAADAQDFGFVVELPAGSFLVEFGRQGGEIKCAVGGKPREVKPLGKAASKMTGVIGLSLPAGSQCTIASIDFAAR
ncbi:MAG: hypothetical protein IAF94_25975 [Pirellulaceae bacterium]|nr:hypothetical protein [Pirellulaceae bacterium]